MGSFAGRYGRPSSSQPRVTNGRFGSIGNAVKAVVAKPQSADAAAAEAARAEERRYQELYRPLNQELIGDVDSTRIIDNAREAATLDDAKRQARSNRAMARYGVGYDPITQQETQRLGTLSDAKFYDDALNNARVQQFERNTNLRNELINLGRGISKSATGGLADAAANEVNRNNANRAMDAQNKAARDQFYGQMAGLALMAMI